jgi:hypothetical protein
MNQRWPVIGRCERALLRYRRRYPKMSEDLWGHLVGACENAARLAEWPATSQRWKAVRRVLLKAARDSNPKASDNEETIENPGLVCEWPAPCLDAVRGLPFLAYRLGRADYGIKAALRKLCLDKSLSLRPRRKTPALGKAGADVYVGDCRHLRQSREEICRPGRPSVVTR